MADLRAVLWDLGGVLFSSPFEAFARYEQDIGVPVGTIRRLNARNPDTNAWSKLERNQVNFDQFAELFEAEAAEEGLTIDGHEVLHLIRGQIRPAMVEALRLCKARFKVAALTNNIASTSEPTPEHAALMTMFDVVVESSKVGARKPEPHFYEMACRLLEVEPAECVFLDDLGVNLKPAAAMGMRTIKVIDPADALRELSEITGLDLL